MADQQEHAHDDAHAVHHKFDFGYALAHHNLPYPAVEWIHNAPIIIFDLSKYGIKTVSTILPKPRMKSCCR